MMFADRLDAATRLSRALQAWRGRNPLVLAIPRGAVPMGRLIAQRLGGALDVVLVRKLRAPGSPEFAIGSIDESGWAYIAPHARSTGASDAYIEEEKRLQLDVLRDRRATYTPGRRRDRSGGTRRDRGGRRPGHRLDDDRRAARGARAQARHAGVRRARRLGGQPGAGAAARGRGRVPATRRMTSMRWGSSTAPSARWTTRRRSGCSRRRQVRSTAARSAEVDPWAPGCSCAAT